MISIPLVTKPLNLRIRGEVEELGVLPRSSGIEQVFHHCQCAIVVLNHPGQE